MACPRCGATSPETSAGGLCNYCRYKMAEEDAAKKQKRDENNKTSSSKKDQGSNSYSVAGDSVHESWCLTFTILKT